MPSPSAPAPSCDGLCGTPRSKAARRRDVITDTYTLADSSQCLSLRYWLTPETGGRSHRYWLAGGSWRGCPVAYRRCHPSWAGKSLNAQQVAVYKGSDGGVLDRLPAPPVSGGPSSGSWCRSPRYWPASGGRLARGGSGPPSAFVQMCGSSLILVRAYKS